MNKIWFFYCLLLAALGWGCKNKENVDVLPNEEIILTDVSYGTYERQKMDVYLPENRSRATKIIIYIHGGGWYQGDKGEIKDGAIYFQQQGFAFISINYRLTRTADNNVHPAQMQDIDHVIRLIGQKQQEWSLADDQLAFFGGSAGAHLSLLYAYKYNAQRKVKAVISVSGPTDLTDDVLINSKIGGFSIGAMIESYIGAPIITARTAWQEASPLNYITAASVPTLFVHGTIDSAVPYQQSVSAYDKLKKVGGTALLEPLVNVEHDLQGTNWSDLLPKMINFLETNVK
jgi:acetyl esterase/lipase